MRGDEGRVLVAYGTKHGATAEIARGIAGTLRTAGLTVDLKPAASVCSLEPYRAVVLGSAVYAGCWRRDALRILRQPELADREVWLFSSGPVGEDAKDSASAARFTRPRAVQARAVKLGAHDHVVFGGMVAEDAGYIRRKMARGMRPELRDRRDWQQIHGWAQSISAALGGRLPTKQPA